MDYMAGAAALIGLCLSSILTLAILHWMVAHQHARLTVAWLFAAALLVVLQSLEFLYHAAELYQRWPMFLKIIDPLVVLMPLCLYGYIRALLGENLFTHLRTRFLHLSPAIVVALLALPYWSLPAADKVYWMQQVLIEESRWQPLAPFGNVYLAIIASLSLVYWWRQQQQGCRGRKVAVQQWIAQLQRVQLIIATSLFARIVFSEISGVYPSVVYALAPGTAYLLYIVLVRAQLPMPKSAPKSGPKSESKAVLATMPSPVATTPELALANPVAQPVPAADDQQSAFDSLQQALTAGAFRDNHLSLASLAQQCGLSSHQASAAINQCHGNNFYDLLNEHRIHAARQALVESDDSVSAICYAVGFNSKSTFNTAFRRLTGCTPTQYRQQHK